MKKNLLFLVLIISLFFAANYLLKLNLHSRNCSPCFVYSDAWSSCDDYCKRKGRGVCSDVRLISASCAAAPYFPECNIMYECICTNNSCRVGVYSIGCTFCQGSGGGGGEGFDDIPGDYGNWHDPNWL